jgi:SAM-dependent methyltransferase
MAPRDPKKFDPADAHLLDTPKREDYLPAATLIAALELTGVERIVDYGAGTGRLALAADAALDRGEVVAVEESPEMYERLSAATAGSRVLPLLITANEVPLPDRSAERVLAVSLLHEVRGEGALAEMGRLLSDAGQLLVVDWARDVEREFGPPDRLLYTASEADVELAAAGLRAERLDLGLPFHFALRARRMVPGEGSRN